MFKFLRDYAYLAALSLGLLAMFVIWRLEVDDPSTLVKVITAGGIGTTSMSFVLCLERIMLQIHNRPQDVLRQYFED